ncbi:MAG: putative molybdenum carrier protein [Deltaproteobacteria bacterium]|nr:putative molybdenum carrier protein [Deltaproteobacteria bacterium]
MTLKKIISGGQTGADRAALDAAIRFKIPHGGWVPKGRRAEDGWISERYQLKEMPTGHYWRRTEQNVLDSEGTLIFSLGPLKGGSELTLKLTKKHRRPSLHLNLEEISVSDSAQHAVAFIQQHHIHILNIAGPRASESPGIYQAMTDVLDKILGKKEKKFTDMRASTRR